MGTLRPKYLLYGSMEPLGSTGSGLLEAPLADASNWEPLAKSSRAQRA